MNIKRAIELYRKNIKDSIFEMNPFTMVGCNSSKDVYKCGCVQGVEFEKISFTSQQLIISNGYKFKLSIELSNLLEREFLPLIQPERLGQNWSNRNVSRRKM